MYGEGISREGSLIVEQGTDLHTIQELLGHNDIKTTTIYLHVSSTHKAKIPNPLDTLDNS